MLKYSTVRRSLAQKLVVYGREVQSLPRSNLSPRYLSILSNNFTNNSTSSKHNQNKWSNNQLNTTKPKSITENTQNTHNTSKRYSSTSTRKYKYFDNVEVTTNNIAIITFNGPKAVNTISFALKDEAKELWTKDIENNPKIKGVVFLSSKKDNFIAGADIQDINDLEDKKELYGVIEDGMDFFQRMKGKGIPLVAGIDGSALGGEFL